MRWPMNVDENVMTSAHLIVGWIEPCMDRKCMSMDEILLTHVIKLAIGKKN